MALKDKVLNGEGLNEVIGEVKNYVKANPTLAGIEASLTGLEVQGTKYAVPQGTLIEANPTLSGTETVLEGIQIENIKYKVLPSVTTSDQGKFLRVNSSGTWVAETVQTWQGGSY